MDFTSASENYQFTNCGGAIGGKAIKLEFTDTGSTIYGLCKIAVFGASCSTMPSSFVEDAFTTGVTTTMDLLT